MAGVLIAPHAVAALVLAVAGVAKLRSPRAAADAVSLPPIVIRILAAAEVGLAAVALIGASAWSSAVMAALYAGFATLTVRLAQTQSACGCFGAEASPASPLQSVLSAALAMICLLSALLSAPAAGWILGRPPAMATVLIVGVAGAVYAVVLAYTELPQLWRSWSPA